jgi:hypothetical protein
MLQPTAKTASKRLSSILQICSYQLELKVNECLTITAKSVYQKYEYVINTPPYHSRFKRLDFRELQRVFLLSLQPLHKQHHRCKNDRFFAIKH